MLRRAPNHPCRAGALGAITQVTPSNQATSPAATLTVNWRPNSADAHPAQSASYSLWRYRTGDTDTTRLDVCTDEPISATQVDGVTEQGSDLQLTNVGFCTRTGVTTLDSGRCGAGAVVGHERSRRVCNREEAGACALMGHSRYAA